MRVPAFFFLTLLGVGSLAAHEVETYKQDGVLITEGWVDSTGWHDKALAVIRDYGRYHDWATRWMDGKDPVSKNFWATFTDFRFVKPDIMILVYDVNLGWPFGSKDNKAKFKIDDSRADREELSFILAEKPLGLDDARLIFTGEHLPDGGTRIRFSLKATFWGLLLGLINVDSYARDMNWRINKMIENLQNASGYVPAVSSAK